MRLVPKNTGHQYCRQRRLYGKKSLFLVFYRSTEKFGKATRKGSEGCEKPELEPTPEEPEAVGEIEGEGVWVLTPGAPAAGGGAGGEEAEAKCAERAAKGRAGVSESTLFLLLSILLTAFIILFFIGSIFCFKTF